MADRDEAARPRAAGPADPRMQALLEFTARASNVGSREILDRAAVDALAAFEAAGTGALLLKGPVLARRLYRPGEQRSYLDIDILVDPDALEAARSALVGLGYNKDRADASGVDNFLGVVHAETWAARTGCSIDLHWQLPGCRCAPRHAWSVLHGGRDTLEIANGQAPVPGPDALALHVATHAAQGGLDDVKAIGDLARAVERWPLDRWRAAASLADALDATAAFAAGLRLLAQGAALAGELGLPATAELEWEIRHQSLRPRGTFHVRGLLDADGWAARARVVRRSLFPRSAWIRAQMPWARGGRFALAAAYALHVARAPSWGLRAYLFDRRARRAGRSPTDN